MKATKKKNEVQWAVVAVRDHGLARCVQVYGPFSTRGQATLYARHCEEFDGERCSIEPMTIQCPWVLQGVE